MLSQYSTGFVDSMYVKVCRRLQCTLKLDGPGHMCRDRGAPSTLFFCEHSYDTPNVQRGVARTAMTG